MLCTILLHIVAQCIASSTCLSQGLLSREENDTHVIYNTCIYMAVVQSSCMSHGQFCADEKDTMRNTLRVRMTHVWYVIHAYTWQWRSHSVYLPRQFCKDENETMRMTLGMRMTCVVSTAYCIWSVSSSFSISIMIWFSRSLLPRCIEKRPRRLRLEIEIK